MVGLNNGDVKGVFLENAYGKLPAKGKIVIDVGANIGDSCIYFALRGAKRVIGLEPLPRNHALAEENVKVNNLGDMITIMLAGCSGENGYISIDPESKGSVGQVESFKEGIRVPLKTLGDILNTVDDLKFEEIVLKMDCEGCEFNAILSESEETIRMFSDIQIEYHKGYKNLKAKLENCGFVVKINYGRE